MEINCTEGTTIQTSSVQYGQQYNGQACNGQTPDRGEVPCLSSRAPAAVNER